MDLMEDNLIINTCRSIVLCRRRDEQQADARVDATHSLKSLSHEANRITITTNFYCSRMIEFNTTYCRT